MAAHYIAQGFLACALLMFPLWVIFDVIDIIINKNKEDDE